MKQSTEKFLNYVGYSDLVLVRLLADPYYGRDLETGVVLNKRFFLENETEIRGALGNFLFGEMAGKHSLVYVDEIKVVSINQINIGAFIESVLDSPGIIEDYLYEIPSYQREVSDGKLLAELIGQVRFLTVPEELVIDI